MALRYRFSSDVSRSKRTRKKLVSRVATAINEDDLWGGSESFWFWLLLHPKQEHFVRQRGGVAHNRHRGDDATGGDPDSGFDSAESAVQVIDPAVDLLKSKLNPTNGGLWR